MPDEPMCYVAKKACGCMVAATVDVPRHRRDTAKEIAAWLRDGLTVERVTIEYVRQNWVGHKCPHEAQQMPLLSKGKSPDNPG